MQVRSILLVIFFAGSLVWLQVFPRQIYADFATSSNFRLDRGVIDEGGGHATSSNFVGEGSIGQAATGISTSTSFILKGGFLYFANVTNTVSTSTTTTSTTGGGTTGQGVPSGGGGLFPPASPPETKPEPTPEIIARCDFNGDDKCNIIDLSIMLFYYGRSGTEITRYDLDSSRIIDFPDVSVLMYYWTG